jgi:NitT/TauT family transport system substrate-binding protein
MAAALAKFVNASRKGWDCAVKNQPEAVNIVLKNDASGAQTEQLQARMTCEVAKRVAGGSLGRLDPEAFDRTVATLMTGRCDPIITKKPLGATTDAIWTAAQK